jgi:hypothetical protein
MVFKNFRRPTVHARRAFPPWSRRTGGTGTANARHLNQWHSHWGQIGFVAVLKSAATHGARDGNPSSNPIHGRPAPGSVTVTRPGSLSRPAQAPAAHRSRAHRDDARKPHEQSAVPVFRHVAIRGAARRHANARAYHSPVARPVGLGAPAAHVAPAAGTWMPSRAATRRAVASRRAVVARMAWRARATTSAGALSGVPLSNGGSGA